jgi:mRNA interferase RelE/StbE
VSAYALQTAPAAVRSLQRLPESAAAAVVEFVTGALLEDPYRLGKAMRAPYLGLRTARRGAYRIIYRVLDAEQRILVVDIDHRADVYRRR